MVEVLEYQAEQAIVKGKGLEAGIVTVSDAQDEKETGVLGDRTVNVFYDEVMLGHNPEVDLPFVPSRVEKRVRNVLQGLDFKWSYPEHPGRLTAIMKYLEQHPVPGVQFKAGSSATYNQLARVHTTSYLDNFLSLFGKSVRVDSDTTAVSPDSVNAALAAAGNAIADVESVVNGACQSAFADEATEFHRSAFSDDD